jgi:pyruvate formate lyase activating enzyme
LRQFIEKIKNLGFPVKLDTNGSNPEMLKDLVSTKLVDYVAMDIKAPRALKSEIRNPKSETNSKFQIPIYETIMGEGVKMEDIEESVNFLKTGKVDFEFRTTVVNTIHAKEDFLEIAKWIGGPNVKYYLQGFRAEKTINPDFEKVEPLKTEFLKEIAKEISPYFKLCQVR